MLCYHVLHASVHSATVGVRELRQNLSVYLDRVKKGEALTVTEHGAAVAILRPLANAPTVLARLVAEGARLSPRDRCAICQSPSKSGWKSRWPEILDDMRAERL